MTIKIDADEYLLTWNDASSTVNEKVMHETGCTVKVKRVPVFKF